MLDGISQSLVNMTSKVGKGDLDKGPNFDSQANRKIENDTSVPHSTENAAQALPEDLRLDLDVNLSFSIDVDGIAKAV